MAFLKLPYFCCVKPSAIFGSVSHIWKGHQERRKTVYSSELGSVCVIFRNPLLKIVIFDPTTLKATNYFQ